MISISTLWAVVIAAIGLVMTVMNIIDKSMTFKERAKKPDEEQNMRIATLENDVVALKTTMLEHEKYFSADKKQIEEIKEQMQKSNRIIIQSLQSLISHNLNNNNIDELKESKHQIEEYLLNK
jgi:hypothetical protein